MSDRYSEDICKELTSLYYRLADLVEEVRDLRFEIKKLKNHPINFYPEIITNSLLFWWETKGTQSHLLNDIYDFLNDFKSTRNHKLKKILYQIEITANEIQAYDKYV